ncbi:MAG TPA: hypothetical protein V6C72_13415, partial [Chroococcales cyanobacterium]
NNRGTSNFGASRHSIDMPVGLSAGSQDVRVVGSAQGQTPVMRTEVDVTGRVIGGPQGAAGIPNLSQLGGLAGNGTQQVRQQLDINVRPGVAPNLGSPNIGNLGNIGGGTRYENVVSANVREVGGQGGIIDGGSSSVQLTADGNISGSSEVRVGGVSGGSETIVQNSYVEGYILPPSQGAQSSAINSQDINSAAQRAADSYKANVHYAQQVIMDMHSAGYTDAQVQDPFIAKAAMAVHRENPSMLGTAAITARIMGSQPNTQEAVEQVHVVQQMIDAGWSANQIQRPDVITSQAIINTGGGYPTPQYVREVRMDKRYYPKPGFAVPQDLAAERMRQRSMGRMDGFQGSNAPDYR